MPDAQSSLRWKTIAFPTEHGGWGFLFEPILLGLLVAFSGGGLLLGLMTVAAFLARHPLKLYLKQRRRHPAARRVRVAGIFALSYLGTALGAGVGVMAVGGFDPLLPFVLLSPFLLIYWFYDQQQQARQLLPELAGPLGLAASAPGIALAAGWNWPAAAMLWVILTARSIPSILYVRARLRLEKGQPFQPWWSHGSHLAALALLALLAVYGRVPWLAAAAEGILLVRAAAGLSAFRKAIKAKQVGFQEIAYGLIFVLLAAMGYWWRL